jgi:hypothetical protein
MLIEQRLHQVDGAFLSEKKDKVAEKVATALEAGRD